ncbi:MAG: hypothetical protein V5A52_08240 [Halovenus sp.]
MCHGFTPRDEETEHTEEIEQPEFLNEESETETELVTDGGDDEE